MKTLLLFALSLFAKPIQANYNGTPIIWQDGNAAVIAPQMVFMAGSGIQAGSADPTSVATEGTAGSIYLRTNGFVYIKNDNGITTNWSQVSTGGGGGVPTSREINTQAPLAGGGDLSTDRTISIPQADTDTDGYLGSDDFDTFNSKVPPTRVINTTSPITGGGDLSVDRTIAIPAATSLVDGFLKAVDWVTFNAKQAALTFGNITTSTSGVTIGFGTSATVGPNVTVNVDTASGSQPGLLSAPDWVTFNNKQPAGDYITALTGEAIASGPGSASTTLSNSAVIGKVLTGYTSGAGTVAATDTILQAIQKLNGNDALKVPLTRNVNTSAPLSGGGALSSDLTIVMPPATATTAGYLSAPDFATFNAKQPAGNYITALTGDVSASGPGSVAATVNSVGGSSAANVHTAELLANAATSDNTVSTIVKRDSNGDFIASVGNFTSVLVNAIASLFAGSDDPTTIAKPGNPGSIYMRSNNQIYKKLDSGTTTNWIEMTAGAGLEYKLGFVTQPPATAVPGVAFTTQPAVTIQDFNSNTVTRSTATVTLAAFTASNCTTAGVGTLSNNTDQAFQGLSQYVGTVYNRSQTIYLKATNDNITSACSTGITINVPPGLLDITFGTSGVASTTVNTTSSSGGRIFGMAKTSDDRIIMVGQVATPNETATGRKWHIAMFKSDGSGLDTTFGSSGIIDTNANDTVTGISLSQAEDVVVDSSDNIYVGGTYYNATNSDWRIQKYDTSGNLISAFGTSGVLTPVVSTVNERLNQLYIDGGTLIVSGCSRCGQATAGTAIAKYNLTTGVTIVSPVFTTSGVPATVVSQPVNGAIGKLSTGEFIQGTYTSANNTAQRWMINKWTNGLTYSGSASEIWSGTTSAAGAQGFTQITDLVIDPNDRIYAVGTVNVNSAAGAAGNDVSIRCWVGSTLGDCTGFGTGTRFNSGITSTSCSTAGNFTSGNDLAGKAIIDGTNIAIGGAGLVGSGYRGFMMRVTSAGIMDSTFKDTMCNLNGVGDTDVGPNSTTQIINITPFTQIPGMVQSSFDGDYISGYAGVDTGAGNPTSWILFKEGQ